MNWTISTFAFYFLCAYTTGMSYPETCSNDMERYERWKHLAERSGELTYLAEGEFGKVYRFRNVDSDTDFVIKEFKPAVRLVLKLNEAHAMSELKGKMFALGLYDDDSCFYDNKKAVLKSQFYNTDLDSYVRDVKNNKAGSVIWKLMILRSILTALMRFHKHNLLHLDLKPQNILMRNEFDVILADFNFTIEVGAPTPENPYPLGKQLIKSECGSLAYRAPEVSDTKYYRETDVYAAGIALFIILTEYDFKLKAHNDVEKFLGYVQGFCVLKKDGVVGSKQVYCDYFDEFVKKLISRDIKDRPREQVLLDQYDIIVKRVLRDLVEKEHKTLLSISFAYPKFVPPHLITQRIQTFIKRISLGYMLERFLEVLEPYKSTNPSYYITMMEDNKLFFNSLKDNSKMLLGKPVKDFIKDFATQNGVKTLYADIDSVESLPKVDRNINEKKFLGILTRDQPTLRPLI